jgi:hypothetical protein
MASSQNFFVWFRGALICQRGLIPRKKKSCGVSDPTELSLAGYQTLQNNGRVASCVHFTADTCSARSDTPLNKVLRGYKTPRNKVLRSIKPCRTSFRYEYFCKFETEFKNILGCQVGDHMGSIRGKN